MFSASLFTHNIVQIILSFRYFSNFTVFSNNFDLFSSLGLGNILSFYSWQAFLLVIEGRNKGAFLFSAMF